MSDRILEMPTNSMSCFHGWLLLVGHESKQELLQFAANFLGPRWSKGTFTGTLYFTEVHGQNMQKNVDFLQGRSKQLE